MVLVELELELVVVEVRVVLDVVERSEEVLRDNEDAGVLSVADVGEETGVPPLEERSAMDPWPREGEEGNG